MRKRLFGPVKASAAGLAILIFAIAESAPNEIVAYVAENRTEQPAPGQIVELRTNRAQPTLRRSQVVAVAPTVERLPQRLWLNPTTPAWGRPFLIAIPEGFELRPGELVTVTQP